MNRKKTNNQLTSWCFKVLLFSALFFFLGKEVAVANSFSIISVGFLPDDRIEIKYDYEGGNILDIQVMYVPDLTNPINQDVPEDLVEFDFDNNLIIVSGFEPDVWTFILFAQFEDFSFVGSDYHSTIFLKEIESSSIGCDVAVDALWTNYAIYTSIDPPAPPVPAPFDRSELLISRYNNETETCATAEMTILQEPLSFSDSEISAPLPANFNPNHRYCFRVRSFSETDTDLYAYSNYIKDVSISDIIAPQHIEIISVDVDYDAENIVVAGFSKDPDISDFVFELYRSSDGIDFPDDPVQQLLGADVNPTQFHFIDDVDVNQGPYFYTIKTTHNECDIYYTYALETAPSIFLEDTLLFVGTDLQVLFNWEYDPFFDTYSLPSLIINQQEVLIDLYNSSHSQQYLIEDKGTLVTAWIEARDIRDTPVRSNITNLQVDILDRDNIPNALRPESEADKNTQFVLPFLIDTSFISYDIKIYDKNGQLIFRSNPDDIATWTWDGTYMNSDQSAPAGAYVYELEYAVPGSPPETQRGVVYLIR